VSVFFLDKMCLVLWTSCKKFCENVVTDYSDRFMLLNDCCIQTLWCLHGFSK